MQPVMILIGAAAVMFAVIGGLSMLAHYYTLFGIKSKTVGDGQHGTAQWAGKKEIREVYKHVTFDVAHWRRRAADGNSPAAPLPQGLVVGSIGGKGNVTALVDTGDVHCLMIGAAGVGKTAFFLYPNIEYACASGMSFLCTDTKGDLFRNYAGIAKDCYGYNIAVIDLRNPTRSDGNNLLQLVNKHMDIWREDNDNIAAKAKAEKSAKIIAKTITNSSGDSAAYGQNAFFYDAAEGLLTATILLIAEFLPPTEEDGVLVDKRHIVSVYKLVQDLLEPAPARGKEKPKSQFQILMGKLPSTHKAKWFAGAALNSADQAMASILSTVLSRLNAFLDSELEQILCFDSAIDAEKFCTEKSAIFLILPEEDSTKYFMVSLFLQQFYREMLSVADMSGGKLPNRVMIYADEIGTIPKIESFEMMLSAGRSRRISVVPIIQSFAQLDKNYGKEGAQIVVDNCQLTLFGGFAPNSESAQVLSKALGSFVVTKTGANPIRTRLRLFLDWGITFGKPYEVEERSHRKVYYADREELMAEILRKYPPRQSYAMDSAEPPVSASHRSRTDSRRGGGQAHTPDPETMYEQREREFTEQADSEFKDVIDGDFEVRP